MPSASAPAPAAGRSLRIVFRGYPRFRGALARAAGDESNRLVGAISQPDRPRRGRRLQPTPIRAAAEAHGIPLLQPEKVGAESALEWLRSREPDIGVIVAFGQFIPRGVRELPPLGMINAHASLLPRHRGAAPIAYAILCGDAETGISIMRVAREMDAGEVFARRCGGRRSAPKRRPGS